uniref:Glucan endo-1,3-beta-glucosidase, basic vacuolar isoform n=1 Tax=Anthurium amnicola TaxID=1678845 RepID=A0A1D1YYE9_9ARAE
MRLAWNVFATTGTSQGHQYDCVYIKEGCMSPLIRSQDLTVITLQKASFTSALSMASVTHPRIMAAIALLFCFLMASQAGAQVGVCYGMVGNNLPPPAEVVALYRHRNIGRMRIYGTDAATLQALRRSGIELILDVPRQDLQRLASTPSAAADWVQRHVSAYWPDVRFRYIAVGNELIPGAAEAQFVLPAMRNVYAALSSAGLQSSVKVSTAVDTGVLGRSYPPSAGEFSAAAGGYMGPILQFLATTGAPLLANVYPYFAYAGNPRDISLPYALFTAPGTVVSDAPYTYQNLFDAILDSLHAALGRAGGANVAVVVSESGWPSAGGTAATPDNAQAYNQNLIRHVARGTPRRPGRAIETYVFAMFNENNKAPGIERNFGLFYPTKQPVYPINF